MGLNKLSRGTTRAAVGSINYPYTISKLTGHAVVEVVSPGPFLNSNDGSGDKLYRFTTSRSLNTDVNTSLKTENTKYSLDKVIGTNNAPYSIYALGGGGGGGASGGGGGGAGGVSVTLDYPGTGSSINVVIGNGGSGGGNSTAPFSNNYGSKGQDTTIDGGKVIAYGGGAGGGRASANPDQIGGSPGGNAQNHTFSYDSQQLNYVPEVATSSSVYQNFGTPGVDDPTAAGPKGIGGMGAAGVDNGGRGTGTIGGAGMSFGDDRVLRNLTRFAATGRIAGGGGGGNYGPNPSTASPGQDGGGTGSYNGTAATNGTGSGGGAGGYTAQPFQNRPDWGGVYQVYYNGAAGGRGIAYIQPTAPMPTIEREAINLKYDQQQG